MMDGGSRAGPAPALRLRGWAPLPPDGSSRDRVATYLPHEREMWDRWRDWIRAVQRTPYGHRVPGELTAVLRLEIPSLPMRRALGRRPLYRAYPLPGRPVDAGWVTFPSPSPEVRDGGVYQLTQVVRRALSAVGSRNSTGPVEILEAGNATFLPVERFYPAPRLKGPGEIRSLLLEMSDSLGTPLTLAETLLYPFVGSPPWHGAPSGLDLVVGSWNIPQRRLRDAAHPLRALLPPWCPHGSRRLRAAREDAASPEGSLTLRPYQVFVDPLGRQGIRSLQGKTPQTDISHLLYGNVETEWLSAILFQVHLPVLRPWTHFQGLMDARPDPELQAVVQDHLIRAHFTEPLSPDPSEVYRAMEELSPRIREALGSLLVAAGLPARDYERALESFRPLRDHLVQGALSQARLWARAEAGRDEFRALADCYLDSVAFLTHSTRPAEVRSLLTQASRIRSRAQEAHLLAVKTLLLEIPDITFAELFDRLKARGVVRDPLALEAYLHQLETEGRILSIRPGTYRWIWL